MRHTALRRAPRRARREQGFILVTGLLFLVVMTLVGLALFRSTGLLDRLTTNTRDKQRSFEAAQSAMEYGVWWLGTPGGGAQGSCASNSGATVASIKVCTEALGATLSTLANVEATNSWVNRAFAYTPATMTVATGAGMNSAGTDVNYYKAPGVYIENLGLSSDGKSQFYQLSSYGYGGDSNTVSVVRATFKQTASTKCRSCP